MESGSVRFLECAWQSAAIRTIWATQNHRSDQDGRTRAVVEIKVVSRACYHHRDGGAFLPLSCRGHEAADEAERGKKITGSGYSDAKSNGANKRANKRGMVVVVWITTKR